jgi:rhamnogalacturonyl hydrolase YesR
MSLDMTTHKTIKQRGHYHAVRLKVDRNQCQLWCDNLLMATGGYEYVTHLFDQFANQG